MTSLAFVLKQFPPCPSLCFPSRANFSNLFPAHSLFSFFPHFLPFVCIEGEVNCCGKVTQNVCQGESVGEVWGIPGCLQTNQHARHLPPPPERGAACYPERWLRSDGRGKFSWHVIWNGAAGRYRCTNRYQQWEYALLVSCCQSYRIFQPAWAGVRRNTARNRIKLSTRQWQVFLPIVK